MPSEINQNATQPTSSESLPGQRDGTKPQQATNPVPPIVPNPRIQGECIKGLTLRSTRDRSPKRSQP